MDVKRIVLAFLGAFVFLFFFSWSTSPLYLTYGGDSPFFQTVGLGILQGKIPYVDLFDHKGPVPFFYNALGYSLGIGRCGVFVIQVISMTITLCLLFLTASLFTRSERKAVAAVALAMIPMADFITEGNQVEEWQLPYIALTLYLMCRYLLDGAGRHSPWKSLVYGLCFGMVFYNRPNDGVMWIGSMFFGLVLLWIVRKKYSRILPNIGAFIGGFACVSAPFFLYFGVHDAIPDFLFGMIFYNIQYATDVLFVWGGIGMILIPLIIVGSSLLLLKDRVDFRYILIPMFAAVVIFIGKRDYYHYLIPLIPFVVVSFSLALERGWKKYLWVVCVLFAVFTYREFTFISRAISLRPTLQTFYAQSDRLFEKVPENERNSIWNYNLVTYGGDRKPHLVSMNSCFLHYGITPSSPVIATFDLFYLEDKFGIRKYEPKWLVMCPSDAYQRDFEYIFANYELVASSPEEPVCELRLYRKKDGNL